MASSSGTNKKKLTSRADSSMESVEDTTEMTTSLKKLCVICGEIASKEIVKNSEYVQMLQIYWCTLGLDVKPELVAKSDLCKGCFDKILQYYETNDIIVYFENFFKSQRIKLLKKTLKGVSAWEKSGQPISKVHEDLKKKFGDKPDMSEQEELQIKLVLNDYKMDIYEIKNDDKDKKSDFRTAIRLDKAGAKGEPTSSKVSQKTKNAANNSVIIDSDSD